MELYWTQHTITNFYTYMDIFDTAFKEATNNISRLTVGVNADFPIQVPIVSESTFLNNFGAALSILGGGIGLLGGDDPAAAFGGGVLGMLGGVFSDVGSNLQAGTPGDELRDLDTRLAAVYDQVTHNTAQLLTAVMSNGDLSGYPSRLFLEVSTTTHLLRFSTMETSSIFPQTGLCRPWNR
jgi:hypothetical protein